jgi:DNA (cytosine-5)-methyltransferase 1
MTYTKIIEKLKEDKKFKFSDNLAYFTHYIHNNDFITENQYKTKADLILNEIRESFFSNSRITYNDIFSTIEEIPFPSPEVTEFTFIDLFAGIGGFRIPLQQIGGKCVFSSEFNQYAQESYQKNFGEFPFGDITNLDVDVVPEHDVLCAGFPCQPFSISGKMMGFEDTRGTLIYHVFKIIQSRQPRVVFLENVEHLMHHDNGNTLRVIKNNLIELGYKVSIKVLNASDFGLPQNRERVIIICSRDDEFNFEKLKTYPRIKLKDVLDSDGEFEYLEESYTILSEMKVQKSGLIFAGYRNKKIRGAGVRPGTEHLSRVHKQPNRIYSTEGIHPALPSQELSGRFWIYHEGIVRKLTIDECFRIMGFPENYIKIESKSELYRQIGNSVAIPMVREVGLEIKNQLL